MTDHRYPFKKVEPATQRSPRSGRLLDEFRNVHLDSCQVRVMARPSDLEDLLLVMKLEGIRAKKHSEDTLQLMTLSDLRKVKCKMPLSYRR